MRHDYLNAKPWPHVVIDNGFSEELLDAIAAEIAKIDQAHLISSIDDRQIKQEASQGLGPATQHFLEFIDSASFREVISTVTGVDNLLSDPTHKFAGAHRTPPGGFTKIHRDFEVHHAERIDRETVFTVVGRSGSADNSNPNGTPLTSAGYLPGWSGRDN